uniref:Uncharacterized protein n=1 Tax=Musa acuminata subsp. malaccensis TaxID=214687 RepID=A0A804IPQ1_MUSAM
MHKLISFNNHVGDRLVYIYIHYPTQQDPFKSIFPPNCFLPQPNLFFLSTGLLAVGFSFAKQTNNGPVVHFIGNVTVI